MLDNRTTESYKCEDSSTNNQTFHVTSPTLDMTSQKYLTVSSRFTLHIHVFEYIGAGERTALVRFLSSVHSIILIGFIRGLKSNTRTVCCLGLYKCVCVCLCVHLCLMFITHQISHRMLFM